MKCSVAGLSGETGSSCCGVRADISSDVGAGSRVVVAAVGGGSCDDIVMQGARVQ